MRLLIFADIHGDIERMRRLLPLAQSSDGVLVAGDFLDAWGNCPLQIVSWHQWFSCAEKPSVICTGNHDYVQGTHDADSLSTLNDEAMQVVRQALLSERFSFSNAAIDMQHRISVKTETVHVTAINWESVTDEQHWKDGRNQSEGRPWIVLYHEPPSCCSASEPTTGSREVRRLIERYQPAVFVCGHIHSAPFSSRSASCYLKKTLVINPGCRDGTLSYVWLDVSAGKLSCEWKCEDLSTPEASAT